MSVAMADPDYILYNMPAMLSRSVKRQDPSDPDRWVRDNDWYREIQQMYFSLFSFLQSHDLVSRQLVGNYDDAATVIVRASELTDLGRTFIKSGIADRWLKAFDRPSSRRDFTDISYLKKALEKLLASSATKRR